MLTKLTDVCTIQYGYAFNSDQFSETEGIPLIRIRDVIRGFSETRTTESFPDEYLVHDGDILIGMDGEFNIARWHGGTAALNQRVCRLIPQKVNPDYIFHFMPSALKAIEDKTPFVTVKHLSAKELNKIVVPIPAPDVQIRIGTILNKIDEIIEFRQRQLLTLDNLIKARFVEMFGDMLINPLNWPEQRLETVAEIVSGITKGRKIQTTELFDVPYMAVSNVKDGYIDWTTVKTIAASQAEIDQYRLLPDDVLMTEGGDPDKLGRGAIIHNPPKDCIHQNHIFRVRLNQEYVLPEFMEQYLQQQRAKRYFLGCAKQTTGIASINMTQLRGLPMLMPPMELQKRFDTFVSQTDKSKAVVQKSLDEAKLLFESLMQKYFG